MLLQLVYTCVHSLVLVTTCYDWWCTHRLLEVLLRHCPGLAEAHLLLAESHHLAGDAPVALRKVADILHRAPDNISAHMLIARIYLHQVSTPVADPPHL